jgi:hypothetical protein
MIEMYDSFREIMIESWQPRFLLRVNCKRSSDESVSEKDDWS